MSRGRWRPVVSIRGVTHSAVSDRHKGRVMTVQASVSDVRKCRCRLHPDRGQASQEEWVGRTANGGGPDTTGWQARQSASVSSPNRLSGIPIAWLTGGAGTSVQPVLAMHHDTTGNRRKERVRIWHALF